MILTITLNPLLERRYSLECTVTGRENRNGAVELKAGGKGINVSRQLNFLNLASTAFTFLGGTNGKIYKEILFKENIKLIPFRIENETRDAAVIIDRSSGSISTYFRENSKISSGEANEFAGRLKKMIENCEIVVFSGSSSCVETDFIFPAGIEYANKFDKISICDTYGSHLNDCIDRSPTIIHNNINEIESSLNISLKSEKDKIDFLDFLYSKGIKQSYLTDGGSPLFAANFDYHYAAGLPVVETVDSTGSGDSFVAGIVYAWYNDLTFEEGIILASALGAVNAASSEACTVKLQDIEELKPFVRISPIGKKMKTLDVTPN